VLRHGQLACSQIGWAQDGPEPGGRFAAPGQVVVLRRRDHASGERHATVLESVLVSAVISEEPSAVNRKVRRPAAAPYTRPGRTAVNTFPQMRDMHSNGLRSRERSLALSPGEDFCPQAPCGFGHHLQMRQFQVIEVVRAEDLGLGVQCRVNLPGCRIGVPFMVGCA
jgi:hypothetical protein